METCCVHIMHYYLKFGFGLFWFNFIEQKVFILAEYADI